MLKFFLFLQPVFIVNQLHFKWLVTGITGVAPANLFFLIGLWFAQGKPEAITTTPFLKSAILTFFGGLTLAFVWAQIRAPGNFLEDLTYFKNALFGPLFYFTFLKCRQDEKTTRRLLIWILVIAFVAAVQGFRQGLDYGFGKYNEFKRASGPFGEDWRMSNRAGVFYGMFMGTFVAMAVFLKKKLWRLAGAFASIVTAGAALSTYSRQSYFLVVLAIVSLLIRRSLIFAVLLAIGGVTLLGYLPDSVTQRVEETKQQGKGGEEEVDDSTKSRWEIWEGGMRMLASNPMGVGLNRWKDNIGNFSRFKRIDAHDFYVLTLGEGGPIGLAALLYLIYRLVLFTKFVRDNRPPDDPESLALTLGLTICTANMALGGIYGSPTLEASVMVPYWALCGLTERYVLLKRMHLPDAQVPAPVAEGMEDRFPLAKYILPGMRR